MDPYSTHIEALVNAVLSTPGDILELGCGDYSTPILSAIAKSRGDKLVVNSSDPEWSSKFIGMAEIKLVDWATWVPFGNWGLVFLDSEQFTSERIKWLPTLAKISKVIVMHDVDAAMMAPDYESIVSGFRSTILYSKHTPWTAVYQC